MTSDGTHPDVNEFDERFSTTNTAVRVIVTAGRPGGGSSRRIDRERTRVCVLLARGRRPRLAKTRFDAIWAEYKYTYPELLAPILALLGRAPEARALVAELSENPNVDPYWVFRTYYALRDFDEALRWLRRAIDYRSRLVLREIRLPNPYPGLQELPEYADAIAYLNTLQRSG